MISLNNYLQSFPFLTSEITEALLHSFEPASIDKGALLLQPGKTARELYFIEQGMIRGYYEKDGKEITHWFGHEAHLCTSYYSFLSETPSFEYIQSIEPLKIQKLKRSTLYQLYEQFPLLNRLGREIIEQYYIQLEERLYHQHFKEARERYQLFCQKKPEVLQRAPLGSIASYLGISQETLSRIRSKKN
jgi:CRP-like cAMP-binding protein